MSYHDLRRMQSVLQSNLWYQWNRNNQTHWHDGVPAHGVLSKPEFVPRCLGYGSRRRQAFRNGDDMHGRRYCAPRNHGQSTPKSRLIPVNDRPVNATTLRFRLGRFFRRGIHLVLKNRSKITDHTGESDRSCLQGQHLHGPTAPEQRRGSTEWSLIEPADQDRTIDGVGRRDMAQICRG